jgi:nicotinamidase-related amidase
MARPDFVLLVVDLQRYYIDPGSSFRAWTEFHAPGALAYVEGRIRNSVIPAVSRLKAEFGRHGWPTVYLRLCGRRKDRADLHRIFQQAHRKAKSEGFPDLYPLASDPLADVLPEASPGAGDAVFDKTTFSGFASGGLGPWLEGISPRAIVFAGLATSQCVDTTARDASDRGFGVVHIEDAQADYGADEHYASLFASRGVCGGVILSSEDFCADPDSLLTRIDTGYATERST